jgi:hypothetical protein
MTWEMTYPHPEVNAHWLCPKDGGKWALTDDGANMVPVDSVHREAVGVTPPDWRPPERR